MIHELIDPKKKTIKNQGRKNNKTLNEFKALFEVSNGEREVEGSGSVSNTFTPPWLRLSLGRNQKNNQNLDWSFCLPNLTTLGHLIEDPKTGRTIPKYKEHNPNHEPENLKEFCGVENSQKHLHLESDGPVADNMLWRNTFKESEVQPLQFNGDSKGFRKTESRVINVEISEDYENEKFNDDDKKKSKYIKQKSKLKKNVNVNQTPDSGRNTDNITEIKVKEISNSAKKDNQPISSEGNANYSFLNEKYCLSNLTVQELKLLQEVNDRVRNKEDLERLMSKIKEINVREWVNAIDGNNKVDRDVIKKEDDAGEKIQKENILTSRSRFEDKQVLSDKDSVKSTDAESDIKRFSEFLSKNQNSEEKRKCLEEVRNYFERKRRTRLTRRMFDERKNLQPYDVGLGKPEDLPRETPEPSIFFGTKQKNFCEDGVVEKAVKETLQKFMTFYNFQVSSSVMGTMSKNILEAIQSDSLEGNLPKKNNDNTNRTNENLEKNYEEKSFVLKQKSKLTETTLQQKNKYLGVSDEGNIKEEHCKDHLTLSNDKNIKLRSPATTPRDYLTKKMHENFISDKEYLKKEFDAFLKSLRVQASEAGLKIRSIILEKENQCSSRSLAVVYNFGKNSLNIVRPEQNFRKELNKTMDLDNQIQKTFENQNILKVKKSIKVQTVHSYESKNVCTQCGGRDSEEKETQTEVKDLNIEVPQKKKLNVFPGLYRMVESPEMGRFYLFPENEENSKDQISSNFTAKATLLQKKDINKNFKLHKKGSKHKQKRLLRIRAQSRNRTKIYRAKKKQAARTVSRNMLHFKKAYNNPLNYTNLNNSLTHAKSFEGKRPKKIASMEQKKINVDLENDPCNHNHLGCFWFWDGKKINPGSDLKSHVETLLKEKLGQISIRNYSYLREMPKQEEGIAEEIRQTTSETASEKLKSSKEKLSSETSKLNILTQKESDSVGSEHVLRIFPSNFETQQDKNENDQLANYEWKNIGNKILKDVGVQPNLQTLSSLKHTKSCSRSSLSSETSKGLKANNNSSIIALAKVKNDLTKKAAVIDFLKTAKEAEKERWSVEVVRSNTVGESQYTLKGSSTSSISKNDTENSSVCNPTSGNACQTKSKDEKTDSGNNMSNDLNLVDHEVQTYENVNYKEDQKNEQSLNASSSSFSEKNENKWKLIEQILNKVSKEERESLWDDMRQYLNKKIKGNVSDEEYREMCIEIEQDVAKLESKKLNQEVMATGHYMKNQGDVEVEIDLTLEDLEKILKNKRKRIRKRQIRRFRKDRKPISYYYKQIGYN